MVTGGVSATAAAADGSMAEQMLAAQNAARTAVKTRPLVWSDKLAVAVQDWANVLITRQGLIHSKKSKYGENMYGTTGGKSTPEAVVKVWAPRLRTTTTRPTAAAPPAGTTPR